MRKPNKARRTSGPLVVTGTTDSFHRKAVNIRSVLKQKIRYQIAHCEKAQKELARLIAALAAYSKNKER